MKYSSFFNVIIFILSLISYEVGGTEVFLPIHNNSKGKLPGMVTDSFSQLLSDSLTKIGGYVWRDIDTDGIQENTDFPLKGVRVELVNYDSNKIVAITNSDANGKFEFVIDKNQDSGYYFLRFECYERFEPTVRITENLESGSDIDLNSVTDTFYLPIKINYLDYDAGFYLKIPDSQCDDTDFGWECSEARIYSFSDLNKLCFEMLPQIQAMPIPGCPAGFAFHNPVWIGFIAADSIISFLIHPWDCVSQNSNKGLQWGVYDSCESGNFIAGTCPCIPGKDFLVNLNGLIAGKKYYLFIDGCAGTQCNVRIEWLTGYCDNEVTDAGSITCNGEDKDCEYFCKGRNYTFFVDPIQNADEYTWQIGDSLIKTANPVLDFQFRNHGDYDISVFGSNKCSEGVPFSKKIHVFDNYFGNLGKVNAILEQLKAGFKPTGWYGSPLTKYGKDSVLVVNSFGCGQWQFIEVVENPDYINLMAFYNATNGPYWRKNSGWKEGADSTNCDPCKGWYGVKCIDARVTSIALPENKLYGKITKELYNLSELKYLKLNENELFGTLPDSISKLKNLEFLDLSYNSYSTTIPLDISNLHNLKSLYLNGNQFFGFSSFIFKMNSLLNLDLSENYLSGEIPDYINMPNLENLSLSNNNYFGNIPAELGNCVSLKSLLLNNNMFTGSIPEGLSKLKMMWRLDLSENELSGNIPDILFSLPELLVLQINDNKLDGDIFNKIKGLKKLTHLYCDNNYFTGTINSEIQLLTDLRYISASNNSFEGQLPEGLFKPYLDFLDLSRNKFSGIIPPVIGKSVYLYGLDLSFNSFSGTLPKEIGKLQELRTLLLNDNNFSGSIPKEIEKLQRLQYLNFRNNKLEGDIPEEIGDMYNLIDFDASNNKLTGHLPASIGKLHRLVNLVLNHNRLTGPIPKEINTVLLDNIGKINLKDNNLSGCYPEELKSLCKPTIVKIFNNNKLLPWLGDFYRFCGSEDQIGAPCNDGDDSNGTNDIIDLNCKCSGALKTGELGADNIFFNNPVYDVLKINSEIDINLIQIFDLKGILLKGYEEINNPLIEIDLSDISDGIYIMKIVNSNKMNIFKLLKI